MINIDIFCTLAIGWQLIQLTMLSGLVVRRNFTYDLNAYCSYAVQILVPTICILVCEVGG